MKELLCDLCNRKLDYPNGYSLDVERSSDAELDDKQKLLRLLRPSSIMKIVRSGYFVCDSCFETLHAQQKVAPDPTRKEMSKNRALYLWETGKWEKPMEMEDFPPISVEDQLPWPNEVLEESLRKSHEGCFSEEESLAIHGECIARLMETYRCATPPFLSPYRGRTFAAIAVESPVVIDWEEFVNGFTRRRLLQDIGQHTRIYYLPYTFRVWFSYRMASIVAIGISLRVQESSDDISYDCYINSDGGHILTVFGPLSS